MNLVIKTTALVFLFMCKSSLSGIDPVAKQEYPRLSQLLSATQGCATKFRHDVKQHAKNNPYFIDPNYTFDIIPKRGDLTHKLRINRATIEKKDQKIYQDQINAEGTYDPKHRQNIEDNFQSLANYQMTNLYDRANFKANMEAVFGFSTSELEQNRNSHRLNTTENGFIDNSTLMVRIADIFGPPPTDLNNLHFKRNIDEKNYQGSLQALIYNSFGPEVLEPSGTRNGGSSITSLMEDDDATADNSGLDDRFPPYLDMEAQNKAAHETSTKTTQNSRPALSTPESRSRQISRNRTDLSFPDSSGSNNWAKTQRVPIPPSTSSSSIPPLPPSLVSQDDVDDSPSSTSSVPTAPSQNGARAQKAYLMLLNSCLLLFLFSRSISC